MNSPVDTIAQAAAALRDVLSDDILAGLSDAERAEVLVALGEISRLAEAGVVEAVATADAEFGHRFGCRGVNELLRRAVLVDAPAAGRVVRAAGAVRREVSLVSGERLPARWPALREALLDGAVGVAGLVAATGPIERAGDRIGVEDRLWADASLAAFARGEDLPDQGVEADDVNEREADADRSVEIDGAQNHHGPRASAEDLRQFAAVLAVGLDPDGAEPSDREAQNRRFVTIGRLHQGSHRLTGSLTPEVAAQVQLIFDAFNNPKVGGAPAPGVAFTDTGDDTIAGVAGDDPFNSDPRNVIDTRTAGQKRHDALAAAVGIAARHDQMPTLAGAAPTLVVHVDAKDVATGTGWASLPDGTPVPTTVATHVGCAGTIQRVLFDEGRIVGITTSDRVFTVHQRRAIIARDRECLTPGCHVPASWCEIHHVTAHAHGGPTHTDNGVPLCWWHHRSLHTSGWEIRMADGVPQIRGPAWWDPAQHWRTPRPTALPQRRRSTVLRT